jgi:hypothetical protein
MYTITGKYTQSQSQISKKNASPHIERQIKKACQREGEGKKKTQLENNPNTRKHQHANLRLACKQPA